MVLKSGLHLTALLIHCAFSSNATDRACIFIQLARLTRFVTCTLDLNLGRPLAFPGPREVM